MFFFFCFFFFFFGGGGGGGGDWTVTALSNIFENEELVQQDGGINV